MLQATQLLESRCQLGEGPIWIEDIEALLWVDIQQKQVHRFHPSTNQHQTIQFKDAVTAIALRERGGFLIATTNSLAWWNGESAETQPFLNIEADYGKSRTNDGGVDPAGNYWIGTMNPPEFTSALYRLNADQTLDKIVPNTGLSNGVDWSPDGTTMYFTDSQANSIYAFDYDVETAAIDNQRVFAKTEQKIAPDGLAVDSEGGVWSAKWNGRRVVRYTPNGDVDTIVDVPTRFVTSLAFGGADLRDMYITTAWDHEENFQIDPAAGNLFHLRLSVAGQPQRRFKG